MTIRKKALVGSRTQLQQVIAGLGDGVVIIEPCGTISWANDMALAMHGAADAVQLGSSLEGYANRFELSYRNGHRLQSMEYPGNRALRGEPFKDVIVQVAPRQEAPRWTHKVSAMTVLDPVGKLDFVVLVLDDETEAFKAERRFEKVFAANPAPAVICRLGDLRFVKTNQGFLEMTGYRGDAVIGRSIYEIDVLERAERRERAIAHLEAGETIQPMEADLTLPSGGSKLVLVAGHPIEIDDEACMLFTFVDLESRRRAEVALRQSEERFACAFRLSPVPMVISTLTDRRILDANDAFTSVFGHDRISAIGRSKVDLKIWHDLEARGVVERRLEQTGSIPATHVRLHAACGKPLECLLSMQGVTILGEPCVLTVIQNVTEQRRSDAQLVAAVEAVMQDTSWLGQKIVAKINAQMKVGGEPDLPAIEDLSRREREILALVAQGAGDAAIGSSLRLSVHTVRNHVQRIYKKIGIRKRADAVVWARQRGLLNHVFERDLDRNRS